MKMDATQKRRIRKVAIVHFVLTVFVFFVSLASGSWFGPIQGEIWFNFLRMAFVLIQPFAFFIGLISDKLYPPSYPSFGPHFLLFLVLILISIPVWSICFGWLYVKFATWLKRFPIFEKKLF
jgi:hypothetical protein